MRTKYGFFCLFLAFASSAYALEAGSPPVLTPLPQQAQAAHLTAQFLQRFHYKPVPLDDVLSARIMNRFIKSLDPDHMLFLQADIDKCDFHTTRTKYLGLIITPGGIAMDPDKVEAVLSWEVPTTKKQLQRFLGFANFYRRFINDFSGVARPLYDLTKNVAWLWSATHQEAFERLKATFAAAPALRIFDWERLTAVEVDSSNWSSGGVLLQQAPHEPDQRGLLPFPRAGNRGFASPLLQPLEAMRVP